MQRHPEAGALLEADDTTAVFEIFIKTSPERLWEAITDPEQRAKYSFGVATDSEWTTGSSYTSGVAGVIDIAEGENVEVDPPNRLVQTFTALWSDEAPPPGASPAPPPTPPLGHPPRRLPPPHAPLPPAPPAHPSA